MIFDFDGWCVVLYDVFFLIVVVVVFCMTP